MTGKMVNRTPPLNPQTIRCLAWNTRPNSIIYGLNITVRFSRKRVISMSPMLCKMELVTSQRASAPGHQHHVNNAQLEASLNLSHSSGVTFSPACIHVRSSHLSTTLP